MAGTNQMRYDYTRIEDAPPNHLIVAKILSLGMPTTDDVIGEALGIPAVSVSRIRNHPVIQGYVQHLREVGLTRQLHRREDFDDLVGKSIEALRELLDDPDANNSDIIQAVKLILLHDPMRTFPKQGITQKDAKPINVVGTEAINEVKQRAMQLRSSIEKIPRVEVVDHPEVETVCAE